MMTENIRLIYYLFLLKPDINRCLLRDDIEKCIEAFSLSKDHGLIVDILVKELDKIFSLKEIKKKERIEKILVGAVEDLMSGVDKELKRQQKAKKVAQKRSKVK